VNGWLAHTGLETWLNTDIDIETEAFDNQNWALRQHLLYHMLNYTLSPESFIAGDGTNITTETTLLFPMAKEPEHTPTPPPGPPWLPRGGEGMLSGHGQRLRIARGGSEVGGDIGRIGVDWMGREGVTIWDGSGWKEDGNSSFNGDMNKGKKQKGDKEEKEPEVTVKGMRWVRNGLVVGVNGVLEPPPSIGKSPPSSLLRSNLTIADEIIRTHPSLSYLSKLLPENAPDPLPSDLSTSPHLTIFAPSNDALKNAFDETEIRYLESDYGVEAIGRILAGGVVPGVGKREQVGWRDTWSKTRLGRESLRRNDGGKEADFCCR
jgi:hypothetical protein